ncbi:MAG: alpha/beta fold hydrolase [Chromatiaceae bacterium]|nr:alpha/beta fold hydrolase [Chromatiaceae bacterium]
MILYLHGLNSSSRSFKASLLRERLAPAPLRAPDYPAHRPDAAIATLNSVFRQIDPQEPLLVVGSSMGGFYGQWLARQHRLAHLYLINPALTPWDLFNARLGEPQTTAQGEHYRITPELAEATRRYAIANPCDGVPTTLLLDRGDEVIDYHIAERLYSHCASAQLFIWDGGDHAFQHMDALIERLRAAHPT